ncbi:MAG: rhomboid family intramembrane serine protease [Microthrixaceae bacterium]
MASLLLVFAVWLPAGAGVRSLATRPAGRRTDAVPILTIAAVACVAVGLAAQVAWSPWLVHLERVRDEVTAGQWWRLVTSLVAQDGGVGGGLSNLAALAVVGAVAEWLIGRRRWALVALAGAVGGQVAGLVMDVSGAGNSIVVVALAAAVAVDALLAEPGTIVAVLSTAALLSVAGLVGLRDLHGFAALAGAATCLATWAIWVDPSRR